MKMGEKYDYLDEERKKLWQSVRDIESKLEELVQSTPLQLQREARGQLNKASEYCNRIIERKTEADEKYGEILNLLSGLKISTDTLDQKIKELDEKYQQNQEYFNKIEEAYNVVLSSNEKWNDQATLMDKNYDTTEEWINAAKEHAENIQTIHGSCESNEKKINNLLTQAADKKQEIVDAYDEIFGYDYDDENTGEKKHEDGLVQELDKAYNDLTKKITGYNETLDSFKTQKETEYNEFLQFKKDEHEAIHKRIKDLLPGALTAGLSHAYNEQCNEERSERHKSLIAFYCSIGVMTAFATIPFIIGLILRYKLGKGWEEVLSYLPQMACAMLPLYLPMLWVAFSSSRKANLSKRLIEEYAHKVTLSKTFQGLEEQIAGLENTETALELKVKLLYNLVAVSAENPGKLIPNYNKADNPLMELMDKSIAFSESLDKLKNIPGISLIAKRLIEKEHVKQEQIAEKAMNDSQEEEE